MAKDKITLAGGFEAEIVSINIPQFDMDETTEFLWNAEPCGTWRIISIGDEDESNGIS